MPSKATLFNCKCDPVYDFGTGHRNMVHFNPQGSNILTTPCKLQSYSPWESANVCEDVHLLFSAEEVRHGDVTAGVKRVWNVITAEKYSFYRLRSILLPLLFEVCTDAGPVDALEVQSSNSKTKVSIVQVHSLSDGPTKGLGVRLTSRSMHLRS